MYGLIALVSGILASALIGLSLFRALRPLSVPKGVRVKIGGRTIILSGDTSPEELDDLLAENESSGQPQREATYH